MGENGYQQIHSVDCCEFCNEILTFKQKVTELKSQTELPGRNVIYIKQEQRYKYPLTQINHSIQTPLNESENVIFKGYH